MTDLEEVIREALAARADDAPSADRLLDGVQQLRRRRRTTRTVVAIAAVAAATAAAVVVPLTLAGNRTAEPAGKPTPAPAPASDDQVIGFHGIEITVPSTWAINDQHCGTAVSDSVIRDAGLILDCKIAPPPGVSSVSLNRVVEPLRFSTTEQFVNAHGVQIQRGTERGGPKDATLVIRAVAVVVHVDAPPPLAARIIDSIRITRTDVTGCPMRERRLFPPRAQANPEQLTLDIFSPGPTSIRICHYSDYWLASAATATGETAENIVRVANSVPPGWVHGRGSPPDAVCAASPGDRGTGYVLQAQYPDGTATTAWAHIGSCGRLGITNGTATHAMTLELARAINNPLHAGFELEDPLLPGPG